MSRSGYVDDLDDNWDYVRYRGAVASALRGTRGQRFLRDLIAALDALPERELIAGALESDGEVCALGAVGKIRGIDMSAIDPEEPDQVASTFDIAECLAREVAYENDEVPYDTPAERWVHMRKWAVSHLSLWDSEERAHKVVVQFWKEMCI